MALEPPPTQAITASGSAFFCNHLLFDFFRDDRLKITHDGGERMRTHHRTKAIVGVGDAVGPFTHGFGYGIFQRCRPRFTGMTLCPSKRILIYIESLADGIFLAHEHHALHVHQRCCGCRSNAVLTCAGFSDNARFTHLLASRTCPSTLLILCAPVWFKSSRFR